MSAIATAELVADRGEAAASEEFFRSRPFLDAEGVTHTLRIDAGGGELLVPLIVRDIPGSSERDAISPYGYPGFSTPMDVPEINHPMGGKSSCTPLEPATVDFTSTGLVSVFIRHSLGEPPLAGARERNLVQIADPELPRKTRGSDRNQINKNRRAGYEVRIVPGPQSTTEDRASFLLAYEETMRRTGAAERYFFGADYFDRILESNSAWLALAQIPGSHAAAASIAVRSDGLLHYYLSGSADAQLGDSPMKNVVATLVDFAADQGLPLNLGGGIAQGDRLEDFKRGFANREQAWRSSEIVCDRAAYDRLSTGRKAAEFFPAYRAPTET